MRGSVWIAVVGCLASGCFETPQAVLDDISCQKICSCILIADCHAQCLAFVAPVTQECFDFATANAQDCSALQDSIMTGGVCRPEIPQPEE